MHERWLLVEEIAAHLGVNPDTIYKWIDRKKMPAHKLGRLWRFLASEVDSGIKAGKTAVSSNLQSFSAIGRENCPKSTEQSPSAVAYEAY